MNRSNAQDTSVDKGSMSISEAFEAYRQVCVFKNQSPKTEESLLVCKRALLAYFGDIQMEALSFELIRYWKMELEKGRSQETVRNYIIKLRVVLKHCKDWGLNVIDPDTVPVPQRTDKVPVFLTEDEVRTLLKHAGTLRNKALISLLYASGVRVSELCRINKGDIKGGCFTVVGKGGKARLCFIDKRAEDFLNQYLDSRDDNNQALFVGKFITHRITSGNVQEIFRIIRKRANIPHAHPHTLRHSFATNLLRNNANMRYVQEMLGHKSLDTTSMYTHVVNNDLMDIYKKHHSV